MKKLVAIVMALGVSGGLVFAKYSNNDLYSVDVEQVEQVVSQPTEVVSLEKAIEQKLAEAILVAQLNQEVKSEVQDMMRDMDAELESEMLVRLDSIELAL